MEPKAVHMTLGVLLGGLLALGVELILVLEDGSTRALGLGGYLDIGVADTMADLFVNFIGAAVFSAIGFFYVKNRGKSAIAPQFIPKVLSQPEEQSTTAGEE